MKIKEYLCNLTKKKSVKNGMWMYVLQIFNTIVPLLTLPYITRILGSSRYGVFSIALNIIGYLQVFVEYGFDMSATRKVALSNKSNDSKNYMFSTVLLSRFLLLGFCIVFSCVYILCNKNSVQLCFSLAILLVSLFGACLQQNWLFQGMQDMKYISIINIVSRIVSVLLIFLLVKTHDDLLLYCFLYSIAPLINGVIGICLVKKKYQIHLIKVAFTDIWIELKAGWYVFTTQLSSKVFGAVGITFLGVFADSSTVGIYSAIQKIPNIMMLAWMPISQVLYPISSKKMQISFEAGKQFVYKSRRIFLPMFFGGTLVVGLYSKFIVNIVFGAEYATYYYWILPLLAWMIVGIDNNFKGIQILLGSGHDKEYSRCFQLGVGCTILFNFVLIYLYDGLGAAIAPLLSEGILGASLRYEIRKLEKSRE